MGIKILPIFGTRSEWRFWIDFNRLHDHGYTYYRVNLATEKNSKLIAKSADSQFKSKPRNNVQSNHMTGPYLHLIVSWLYLDFYNKSKNRLHSVVTTYSGSNCIIFWFFIRQFWLMARVKNFNKGPIENPNDRWVKLKIFNWFNFWQIFTERNQRIEI